MRHDVVVPERRHNRDHIVVNSPAVLVGHTKHLSKLCDQELVLTYDLLLRTCMFLVVVVSRRVARPDYEVDIVLNIVVDPSERLIDKRER